MAAVLRIKRRHEDEPLNALLIACKRRKSAENEEVEESPTSNPLTTVLKFAGTVKNQEESVVQHLIQTLGKDKLKENYKQHYVNYEQHILTKLREEVKKTSAKNRYKVINCIRSLDNSNVEELKDKVMTVIDVEDSISCANGKENSVEKDDNYVYDLYYGQTENDIYMHDMVSIHPFEQELVYDTYRDNGYSEVECESEDSNSESNWRNDYPDSDSERSIDEDDMKEAVMNMRLDDNSDLSSEDDFVYAVNENDVEAYGYKYAKYKARMREEFDEDDSNLSEYSAKFEHDDSEDDNEL